MNYYNNDWPEADVAELRRLCEDGISASLIGDKLGKSKNSVIGKMHRLGITKARSTEPGKRRPQVRRSPPPKPAPVAAPEEPAPAPVAAPKPPPQPVDLRDMFAGSECMGSNAVFALQVGECKWPVGTPGHADFRFCAARQLDGHVYCAAHAREAFGWKDTE